MTHDYPFDHITKSHIAALLAYISFRNAKGAAAHAQIPYEDYKRILSEALYMAGCDRCTTKEQRRKAIDEFFVHWEGRKH
jgi:hypothetical protein